MDSAQKLEEFIQTGCGSGCSGIVENLTYRSPQDFMVSGIFKLTTNDDDEPTYDDYVNFTESFVKGFGHVSKSKWVTGRIYSKPGVFMHRKVYYCAEASMRGRASRCGAKIDVAVRLAKCWKTKRNCKMKKLIVEERDLLQYDGYNILIDMYNVHNHDPV